MRLGTRRGVIVGLALVAGLVAGRPALANNPFHHTIPKEIDAIDIRTGGPLMAPPIPYGHYNKTGHLHKGLGLAAGSVHGLLGKAHGLGGHGLCGSCGGKGCGSCKGSGLFSGHDGHGHGHDGIGGHGHGRDGIGHGHGDGGCVGKGCGGLGGFGHGKRFKGCGLCGGGGCGVCESTILPSAQGAVPVASSQGASPCGVQGCGLGHGHKHGAGNTFSFGHGGNGFGHGGNGFGHGGAGFGHGCKHGEGDSCGNCGGNGGHGLGLGHGGNGGACRGCGGAGCGLCAKLGGKLGMAKGMVYGLLHPHAGKIEYFVGPGGPVPITPGYVPYINVTRSPRDFLAFPPFTP